MGLRSAFSGRACRATGRGNLCAGVSCLNAAARRRVRTMEDPANLVPAESPLDEAFAETIRVQQSRAWELLAAHRQRLDQAQSLIGSLVDRLAEQLEADRRSAALREEELSHQAAQLQRREQSLQEFERAIEARLAEWQSAQAAALDQFRTLSDQLAARLAELERAGATPPPPAEPPPEAQAVAAEQIEALQHRARTALERQAELEAELNNLRRQTAELEAQRAAAEQHSSALAAELARTRLALEASQSAWELERRGLQERLEALADELESWRRRCAQMEVAEQSARTHQSELRAEVETLRQRHAALAGELAQAQGRLQAADAERESLSQEQSRLQAELAEARRQAAALAGELEAARQQQSAWQVQSEQSAVRQREVIAELAQAKGALTDREAELEVLRLRQQRLEAELQSVRLAEADLILERDRLLAERTEALAQLEALRNHHAEISKELVEARVRHAQSQADCQALRLRETALEEELRAARAKQAELLAQLEVQQRYQKELQAELEAARTRHDELAAQLAEARSRADQLAGAAAAAPDPSELAALRTEREELMARLADAEQRIASLLDRLAAAEEALQSPPAPGSAEQEDYRRRYEMAVEDMRELRAKVAALEAQLASGSGQAPAGSSDWEAQKRRILAALEAEGTEPGAEDPARRLQIEEVLRATDQAIAAKDREIAELRQLLQDQSKNLGTVAVGAAALGQMLDNDAIIREERENLRKLQEEWREKLRQAEIEIAVERAKLARQRAELEERLRELPPKPESGGPSEKAEKPARGRWLARLGLADPEKS